MKVLRFSCLSCGFLSFVLSLPAQTVLTFTRLHSFNGAEGATPDAGLVLASDGNLYGTTFDGGGNGSGAVFKISPHGNLTTLHSFTGTDGAKPFAGLVQGADGTSMGRRMLAVTA